jgi:hypothetical protein
VVKTAAVNVKEDHGRDGAWVDAIDQPGEKDFEKGELLKAVFKGFGEFCVVNGDAPGGPFFGVSKVVFDHPSPVFHDRFVS